MRRTTAAALLLACGLSASQAATQDPAPEDKVPYVVRYLIFQHQGYWDDPLDSAGPQAGAGDHARALGRNAARAQGPDQSNPMASLWTKLSESSRYRPLIEGLAVPFARPEAKAEPIAISGRWRASIRPPFDAMAGLADRPMRVVMGQDWAPPGGAKRWASDRVLGNVTFHKGRYAHLAVDLVFVEPQRWMPWGLDVHHHFLSQSRRLLPNRFYYFDHPRFGVIARIQPMD